MRRKRGESGWRVRMGRTRGPWSILQSRIQGPVYSLLQSKLISDNTYQEGVRVAYELRLSAASRLCVVDIGERSGERRTVQVGFYQLLPLLLQYILDPRSGTDITRNHLRSWFNTVRFVYYDPSSV